MSKRNRHTQKKKCTNKIYCPVEEEKRKKDQNCRIHTTGSGCQGMNDKKIALDYIYDTRAETSSCQFVVFDEVGISC